MGWTIFKTISTPYCSLWAQFAWEQTQQQAWEAWSQWTLSVFHTTEIQSYLPLCQSSWPQLNFFESYTLGTFGQKENICEERENLIPKVSPHRILLTQLILGYSTGERDSVNSGSLFLSINTRHPLLKYLQFLYMYIYTHTQSHSQGNKGHELIRASKYL